MIMRSKFERYNIFKIYFLKLPQGIVREKLYFNVQMWKKRENVFQHSRNSRSDDRLYIISVEISIIFGNANYSLESGLNQIRVEDEEDL